MTTPDHIASTAEVIDRRILPVAEGDPRIGDGHTIARALDAAGLLATPAHDAAVAAKALVGLTYEPTREGWTPYQPWMRDVLADDARTSALFTFHDGESRVAWQDCHGDDAWFVRRDLRIHPDDCPERPVDEDGEAHSTVGNDPCVCLSEEPCRVHDDIEDVTEEPPVDTAPDVDPDEAVWTNDAQVDDDDPDLESVVRAQLDGHGVECHGAVRITSARIARAAREHIYAEPAQEWVARDIREAEARAVQAEADLANAQEEAAEAHSTAIYAEQRAHKAEAERDEWEASFHRAEDEVGTLAVEVGNWKHVANVRGKREVWLSEERNHWKARHAALVADIEAVRVRWHERYMAMPDGHTAKRYAEVIEDFSDELNRTIDRDDERGKAQEDRELFGGSGANAIERGCGEDFRRRFVDPAPDTVILRREDAGALLRHWRRDPDEDGLTRAITARARAALGWGDDSECDHDWEPHDLPDPSSAGAVLQRGHICRDCGKVED